MTKIAVTGYEGMIGSELTDRGYEPLKCDITNLDEVNSEIHRVNPDIIVHCAALTSVAECEEDDKKAFAVNVNGVNNILYDFSGTLIYFSTVHVFNGTKYWSYSERHRPDPVNTYGFTKWAGEEVAKMNAGRTVIIRVSRQFDWNFIRPDVERLQAGEEVEFTTLIKRSFQHVSHFADNLTWLINKLDDFPDLELLNIAGQDALSYYDFWLQVGNVMDLDVQKIKPRTHKIDDYPRPFRGGLNTKKAQKMGMKIYSALDGLKMMKRET